MLNLVTRFGNSLSSMIWLYLRTSVVKKFFLIRRIYYFQEQYVYFKVNKSTLRSYSWTHDIFSTWSILPERSLTSEHSKSTRGDEIWEITLSPWNPVLPNNNQSRHGRQFLFGEPTAQLTSPVFKAPVGNSCSANPLTYCNHPPPK